jgi:hypothetical protein
VFLTDTINALAYTGDERDGRPACSRRPTPGCSAHTTWTRAGRSSRYGPNLDVRTLCVSTSAQGPFDHLRRHVELGRARLARRGKTWEQLRGIPAEAPVNVIERDPKRPENVYVGTTQTLYVSHDGGQHWQRRGGNLPLGSFTSVLINPDNPDEVFVGNAYERGGRGLQRVGGRRRLPLGRRGDDMAASRPAAPEPARLGARLRPARQQPHLRRLALGRRLRRAPQRRRGVVQVKAKGISGRERDFHP